MSHLRAQLLISLRLTLQRFVRSLVWTKPFECLRDYIRVAEVGTAGEDPEVVCINKAVG